MALTADQEDAIKFSFGMLKYLRGGPSPSEPGPGRRGWRFARRISEATGEPAATQVSPMTEETVVLAETELQPTDDAEESREGDV